MVKVIGWSVGVILLTGLVLCTVIAAYHQGGKKSVSPKDPAESPVAKNYDAKSDVKPEQKDPFPSDLAKLGKTIKTIRQNGGHTEVKFEVAMPKNYLLPPKPESQRATEAKRLWAGLKSQQDFLHGCVLQNSVQFGPNDGTTAKSRRSEYDAAVAAKQAWDDYQAILQEEK